MSHLKYYAYEGQGVEKLQKFSYSQAVRLGDRIECSGQGKQHTCLIFALSHLQKT